jgi:hypothetical protein
MMELFKFGENAGPNGKITILDGRVALFHDYPTDSYCAVEIQGPKGGVRSRMIVDKATTRRVGAALLKWSGFNVDVDLLVKQIDWLAWQHICDEQEGLLNLLGALRDLMETKGD